MDEARPRETDTSQEPQRRSDGQQTHTSILDTAMRLASVEGLGSLTIGRLAEELDLSKSGVFAHFGSKERLQQETIDAAEEIFEREVFAPSMTEPEGRPRLEALCEAYLSYVERNVFSGGCFFAQLLGEYDARSGPIHDRVEEGQRGFVGILEGLIEAAKQRGELNPATDTAQMAFELYAPLELANFLSTLCRDKSLIDRARDAIKTTIAAATPRNDHLPASTAG